MRLRNSGGSPKKSNTPGVVVTICTLMLIAASRRREVGLRWSMWTVSGRGPKVGKVCEDRLR
jgi:hypothetical protein